MAIEPGHVFLSCGCAVGAGLIFGIYPALRAGKLSPLEALRHG
jgi:ABC-type antimicrobial peptide transport system permease subunit